MRKLNDIPLTKILNEPKPELPNYIKQPYLNLKKKPKKEKEMFQFKKFMNMLNKIHVNIPFCEALEQIPVYAKLMKELLLGKHKLKHDDISLWPKSGA